MFFVQLNGNRYFFESFQEVWDFALQQSRNTAVTLIRMGNFKNGKILADCVFIDGKLHTAILR